MTRSPFFRLFSGFSLTRAGQDRHRRFRLLPATRPEVRTKRSLVAYMATIFPAVILI
jgi:hypothetical protein